MVICVVAALILKDNKVLIAKRSTGDPNVFGKWEFPGGKVESNEDEKHAIEREIKEELNERARERRLSERGKELYKLRKEKIERSFADSKQNHGFRYAMYKGIEKNQNYTWLICATQNMKNSF